MMKNGSTEVARSQECSDMPGRIGMAERVGFEPTVRFPVRSLSRRVLSTAQSPLRGRCRLNRSRALRFSAIRGADTNALGRMDLGLCIAGGGRRRCESREVRRLKHALVAACSEERLDYGRTVGGEDAGRDFSLMIKARVREDFEAGAHSAALGVVGAVDEA